MANIQGGNVSVAEFNANPSNWSWKDQRRQRRWSSAAQEFQEFNTYHRNPDRGYRTTATTFSGPFKSISVKSAFIRDSYRSTFEGIWNQSCSPQALTPPDGYIITGQPGVGKSLFLNYMLICLLELNQPVLFTDDGVIFRLFLHQHVYEATDLTRDTLLTALPVTSDRPGFVWSLFKIEALEGPPGICYRGMICPVQVASLNPVRFDRWLEEYTPKVIRMQLWEKDELRLALPHQRFWPDLKQALEERALNSGAPVNVNIAKTLRLLQPRPVLSGGDGHLAQANHVEDQISKLLDTMIYHFGNAVQDVFGAVTSYESVYHEHATAFNSATPDLLAACFEHIIFFNHRLGNAHMVYRLFAIEPVGQPFDDRPFVNGDLPPDYQAIFKSDHIKLSLLEKSLQFDEAQVRRLAIMTHAISNTTPLARELFKALAHRILCAPSSTGTHWPIVRMIPVFNAGSTFGLAKSPVGRSSRYLSKKSPRKSSKPSSKAFFRQARRASITFPFSAQLAHEIKHHHYYLPSLSNVPLIDSFTVDIDTVGRSCVLWLLQMTIIEQQMASKIET